MAHGRAVDGHPWETVVSVNLTGTALLLAAFGPLAGPGTVAVCLGSSAAYTIPVSPAVDALLDEPPQPT